MSNIYFGPIGPSIEKIKGTLQLSRVKVTDTCSDISNESSLESSGDDTVQWIKELKYQDLNLELA